MITIAPETPAQLSLFAEPAAHADNGAVIEWPMRRGTRCPVSVGQMVRFPQSFAKTPHYAPWVAKVFAVVEFPGPPGWFQVQARLVDHEEKSYANIFVDESGVMPEHELSVLVVGAT